MIFTESTLENAYKSLFEDEGYTCNLNNELDKKSNEEIILEDDLKDYLVSKYNDLSIIELNFIINEIKSIPFGDLYESNKKFLNLLSKGFPIKRDNSNDIDLFINLIDFENIENNRFRFVNQVKVEGNKNRIPDAVIYINGLPLIVFEFKSAIREDATIYNAYTQLTTRYIRDIPDLFAYNAFVVIGDGINNKYGSVFADYDYFYSWKMKIDESEIYEGIDTTFSMIQGLFNKNILLDVIKNFIYFPDKDNSEKKFVPRYSQYFATKKLLESIKEHIKPNGDGKGGTYFGATGCGKSQTMLYLTSLLMKDKDLKNPTIILITDRQDLDKQLSELFVNSKDFIGDTNVKTITSRDELKRVLSTTKSGGVYLTTIQKFSEDINLLSERNNIICISDEAHRSQLNKEYNLKISNNKVQRKYGFGKYLHDSLPNATYVGFTGTPIDKTIEVFGPIVDSYTMRESVEDGVTVKLIYNGRAAELNSNNIKIKEIEEYYEACERDGANKYQIEESQKQVANMNSLIGDQDRLEDIAQDFVNFYEERLRQNATVMGKALFVCYSRHIAYELYKKIIKLRPEWSEAKYLEELSDDEKKQVKKIPKINMVMTRDDDDDEEFYELLGNDEYRKSLDKEFKNDKSNFKIAIVRDMWTTGFDVPCLDTIFIDKPLKEHTLIQTISRVNRTYDGKENGLIVDYIGIKPQMDNALAKYTNYQYNKFEDEEEVLRILKNQLSLLNNMFYNFDNSKFFNGSEVEQLECLKNASEFIQSTEKLENRFMNEVKKLKSSYNLCSSSKEITKHERELIDFYIGIRSIIFKLTKGDAPDLSQMNKRAMELLEQAIQSSGVEEIISTEHDMQFVDLLSDEYLERISRIQRPNEKIKILERLLKKTINEYGKTNAIKSKTFQERLDMIMEEYNNRFINKEFLSSVLSDVTDKLIDLIDEIKRDKNSFIDKNIDIQEKAFYDILDLVAKNHGFNYPEDKLIILSKEVKQLVSDITQFVDWDVKESTAAELEANLIVLLSEYDYPPELDEEVFKEVFSQAKKFRKNLDKSEQYGK